MSLIGESEQQKFAQAKALDNDITIIDSITALLPADGLNLSITDAIAVLNLLNNAQGSIQQPDTLTVAMNAVNAFFVKLRTDYNVYGEELTQQFNALWNLTTQPHT